MQLEMRYKKKTYTNSRIVKLIIGSDIFGHAINYMYNILFDIADVTPFLTFHNGTYTSDIIIREKCINSKLL